MNIRSAVVFWGLVSAAEFTPWVSVRVNLWATSTISSLSEQKRMFSLSSYSDKGFIHIYRHVVVLLVYIFVNDCKHHIVLMAEMSCCLWPPDTQESPFYSQKAVLGALSLRAIRTNRGTIVWIGGAPLSRLSGSLLIFHNWFSCLHPALVGTNICSCLINQLFMKNTQAI